MRRALWQVTMVMLLSSAVAGCGRGRSVSSPPRPSASPGPRAERLPPGEGFSLSSAAFAEGQPIPGQYTARGQGISPPLQWTAPPAGTKAFALIVSDPDAPGGTYIHWVVYALPAAARSLPGSVPRGETLPQLGGIEQGRNSAGRIGYTPPDPPPGKVHHYHFRLYALDAPVALTPGATAGEVEEAMQGHVLGAAELVGTFERP